MDLQMIWSLLAELRQLRQREHWTRQQLEAYQANTLRSLREYVYAYSPFYQRFHKGLTDRPLHELPVLTKAMLMEHFDELVTDRTIHLEEVKAYVARPSVDEPFLGRYLVNATSGSTGQPGLFLFNRAEWLTVLASFARSREWTGIKANLTSRTKMAVVASTTPWHMSALVSKTLHSWWVPEVRLSASEPIETIVRRLNEWQPEVLVCYASMARLLADEQQKEHLKIAPRAVFTSSEVLTDDTRRRIEDVWGKTLFNQYSATECGGIAAECDYHHGLHLYEDMIIVEVVDKGNRPVPPGTYGDKLLLTVLFHRSQPLIRYELSDSVRLASSSCLSGLPFALLDGIQGREEDVLYFPARAGGEVAVQPLVFSQVLDTTPVSGWQVVQETNGIRVLLSGVRGDLTDETLATTMKQALGKQGAHVPSVTIERVSAIPRTTNGKAPLIKANRSHGSLASEPLVP